MPAELAESADGGEQFNELDVARFIELLLRPDEEWFHTLVQMTTFDD